jgi:hypothetical protein
LRCPFFCIDPAVPHAGAPTRVIKSFIARRLTRGKSPVR